MLIVFAIVLFVPVSADQMMDENTNFQFGEVDSRAHTRSISESKKTIRS